MAHDHNGRVGPPRCEECNAPLNSDDRRSESAFARSLCLDCHLERYPFRRVKKKKGRLLAIRREDKCQGANLLVPKTS
jgi:hypothetical protein